jgi:tetratricopeptide (TPR) repeat protein
MPTRRSSTASEFEVKSTRPGGGNRKTQTNLKPARSATPPILGILITALVLLTSAGATVFFLTKPPDDERLLKQGQQELAKGQYAFAVKTLTKATALRPRDSKAFLALARAYVGVDQVDKAWECVSHAQQLGAGVVAEPALASDLANYYRQRGRYDKAIDLLRPLAKANIPGKRAELADLDALWGDEALRSGDVDLALRCWEEVHDLRDGSRFTEADSRLSTIYQKLADSAASKSDDDKALAYLSKLNYIAQNARNYLSAAQIYEREDKLDLAIEQIRKALTLDTHNQLLSRQLSALLTRRGKELMDAGNNDAGYAYLQQAKSFDANNQLPDVTLRKLTVGQDSASHCPRVAGEVWNPTDKTVNSVNIRAELWDTTEEKLLWSKDNRLVDEFVPPLNSKQSKPFEFIAAQPVKANGKSEFRIFLDGTLYKAYPIGKAEKGKPGESIVTVGGADAPKLRTTPEAEHIITPAPAPAPAAPPAQAALPKLEPTAAPIPGRPLIERGSQSTERPPETSTPSASTASAPAVQPPAGAPTAEEKTMKDLDF